jgi:hypothetical protein
LSGKVAYIGAFVHAAVALVIIVAATVLAALHDLDGQTVAALFGAAVGLIGGSASSLGSIYSVVNGKATVPLPVIADQEATLRNTVDRLAGARAQLPSTAPPEPPSEPTTPPVG